MLDGSSDIEVEDSGLHDAAPIFRSQLQDAIHAGKGDHHAATASQRASGKARASAASDNRNLIFASKFDNAGDVFGALRKHDDLRAAPFHRGVKLVEHEV